MRHFKTVALISALIVGSAFAIKPSEPTGYGTAESSVTATGTYASAVSFTLPNGLLTIPKKQVRPGASFTVTIPVTNTTDRPITITAGNVTAPDNVIVANTSGPVPIAAGEEGYLIYSIDFTDDEAEYAVLEGEINIVFPMTGTDTAETPDNLTVTDGS